MYKVFTIMLALCLVVVGSSLLMAQEVQPSLYGYGSLNVPTTDGDQYSLNRARVGFTADQMFDIKNNLKIGVEYDVETSSLKRAYGQLNRKFDDGSTLSLYAGKIVAAAAAYAYPGPKNLRLPRYPDAFNGLNCFITGILVCYEHDFFTLRLAHFNDNLFATSMKFSGFSMFYEESSEYGSVAGGLFESPWTTEWLHPFMGVTHYENTDDNVFFVQSYLQIFSSTRLYHQTDFGDVDNTWLIGINHEYAKNCFFKLFYETRDEEAIAEVTFAFN